jgi:hypothetical protein
MTQIEEMIIRVPHMGEEEARMLGQEVAQRLNEGLPESATDRYIPALNVQLSLTAGMSAGEMATAISEQLLQKLKMT